MNKKIIYFILAILLFLHFKKVESFNVDVDGMIAAQQQKLNDKFDGKMPGSDIEMPSMNSLVNKAIQGEEISGEVNELIDNASLNANAVNVNTDGNEISDETITNEPKVEVVQSESNEKEGGGMNVAVIIFLIISVLIILKK